MSCHMPGACFSTGRLPNVATGIISYERVRVPGAGWSLVFDEAGERGAFVRVGQCGSEKVQLAKMKKMEMSITPSGERLISTRLAGGTTQHASLDCALSRMVPADVLLRSGATSSTSAIPMYVMRLKRASSAQVFWGLFDLYSLMCLQCFAGRRSTPCRHGPATWAPFFDGNRFLLSKHCNMSKHKLHSAPFFERCMPQAAGSTVALVVCITRWAFCRPERGGLREPNSRQAAHDTLQSQCGLATSRASGRAFTLYFDHGWKRSWPRPDMAFDECAVHVGVSFQPGGKLNLSSSLHVAASYEWVFKKRCSRLRPFFI